MHDEDMNFDGSKDYEQAFDYGVVVELEGDCGFRAACFDVNEALYADRCFSSKADAQRFVEDNFKYSSRYRYVGTMYGDDLEDINQLHLDLGDNGELNFDVVFDYESRIISVTTSYGFPIARIGEGERAVGRCCIFDFTFTLDAFPSACYGVMCNGGVYELNLVPEEV